MSQSIKILIEEKLGKFPQFLIYAILEWVVIILLFIDGFLAFICNELAKLFDLRIPCLLCTRIDHVLVHRNPNFYYNDSICEVHKKDISSLAYCHVHKKLSDIRSICDGCLLSFATEKDSDCDRYKSLVGILHKDIDCFVEDDQRNFVKSGKKDEGLQGDLTGVPRCSCCGDPLKTRPSSKFIRSSSMNANAPTPSPRAPLLSWKNEDGRNPELPHIRYTELKFMSDNDSELPEDEDASIGDNQRREDTKAATVPLLPDSEDINEDASKTPLFVRGNKFFGIPLSDSAQASPRYRAGKKFSMDKPDFVLEPNDINALNEADGDSILTRLKRQVRLDRKSLMALYMELDEERSASAVAANNAMAMITRLQAEKAAVQMEALQYQRMMEEQAEYDQEALQVMKDLLVKRDEEIKVLEADLDVYREKYGPIKKIGSEVCEIDDDEDYQALKSQSLSSSGEKSECGSPSELLDQSGIGAKKRSFDRSMELGAGGTLDESSLDFEHERSYLLGLLKDVERNMSVPSVDQGSHLSGSNVEEQEQGERGTENKPILERELSLIRERLRAIEADSGFLKHAAMTLQKSGEGSKLLTEIAQHLRNLRYSVKMPNDDIDA
ncbi:probable myosin-binding protein 5 isoform X2 [Coffea arabica]|uniref:Probable myosin-binding protein 5 isoform X2 n=1 Tax=Coffea arabica TaxID=13443 RepID=A0ABM4UA52_COFAR